MISMYRVNKEVGTSENVFLQNTDNGAELNLGRITPTMIHILEEDGYKFDDTDGAITLKEKWTLNVTEETKDKLRKLAMPMNKPIRDQRKKVEEDKKQPVDILDIIYGLA
ncbi:MAG: hypothetical protein II393_03035 [Cytophagales bacterium]|nr:hypothetical protein [Cytophagales bacterium]